jgi:hypothetical protein
MCLVPEARIRRDGQNFIRKVGDGYTPGKGRLLEILFKVGQLTGVPAGPNITAFGGWVFS